MFTCFVDVMGQGLAFPVFAALLMQPNVGFLPAGVSQSQGALLYGIAIGTFFLTWFFGSIYVSRLSDSIGRKTGILICLIGAIAGYAIAAVALISHNYTLLVVSRGATGFTAGAQPIAAAAMIHLAKSDRESERNLGLATVGMSFGLVVGPIIGGLFSEKDLLGGLASSHLPFLIGGLLCFMGLMLSSLVLKMSRRRPVRWMPIHWWCSSYWRMPLIESLFDAFQRRSFPICCAS
jgi:DHA1 family tetracycline resistance protein-like MFS transporter